MTSKLSKPYSEVSSWETTKLRHLCEKIRRGRSPEYAEGETDYWILNQACVNDGSIDYQNVKYNEENLEKGARGELQDGDIILNSTGIGTVGRNAIFTDVEGPKMVCADSHLTIIRTNNSVLVPDFLHYVLRPKRIQQYIEQVLAAGATKQVELSRENIADFKIPVPSVEDQYLISEYLDNRMEEIDSALDDLLSLQDLLDEKLRSEITQAVSGYIFEHGDRKETGVEWFDSIPSHWELLRLKRLRKRYIPIVYGIILPGPDQDEGVPIIKGGDCKPEKLDPNKLSKTTYEKASEYDRSKLEEGDLVYEIRGSVGGVIRVPSELEGANLTQDTARISPMESVNGDWLMYALRSEGFRQQMDLHTQGATVEGINLFDLRRGIVPVPPREEQQKISEYLGNIESKLDVLNNRIDDCIDILEQKRETLIIGAVTGEIDIGREQEVQI